MRESSSESDSRGGTPDDKKSKENETGGEKASKKTGSKEKGKKRTKTGCLTCRRRRIKCGEERPTCSNCTKSKRQCEGYSQRVVFKNPNTSYRGPPTSSSVPFVESEPFQQEVPTYQQSVPPVPVPLAPKPTASFNINVITHDNTPTFSIPAVTTPGIEGRPYGFVDATGHPLSAHPGPPRTPSYPFSGNTDTVDLSRIPEPNRNVYSSQDASHYIFEAQQSIKQELRVIPPSTLAGMNHTVWSAPPNISTPYYVTGSSNWPPVSATSTSSIGTELNRTPNSSIQFSPWANGEYQPTSQQSEQFSDYRREPVFSGQHVSQNWHPEEAGVASRTTAHPHEDEDDPFDVSEDEDTKMGECDLGEESEDDDLDTHLKNNDLGVVVALQARQDTVRPRSVTSFIDRPDMLSQYVPSSRSSPLRDPMTARVFCHFINVTGPALSMFERHPANPSLIFKGEPVPKSQQHIWTYTFPILALQSPGLLHAMCALASLHIAKLQNKPITPSLKHYAYSLRRVAKSLSQPSRRGQPATLAAAMLLAFYEVWCADHQKWTNHLLGARMLVREIDFAGTTKYIKSMKQRQQREEEHERSKQIQRYGQAAVHDNGFDPLHAADDVNENIIAILMGKQPRYDQYGKVIDENVQDTGENKSYTRRDLEIYETQRDIFWWYCKQDVYQSILGGGKLFMEYDRWSHCPPRAPLGRLNATYGTFDHLVLLMGRLAEFAAKDLKRKQLAMRINGGYQPPERSPPGPDHQGSQHQQQQYFPQMPQPPMQTQSQMPPFNGMVPVSDPKLPMGFGSRDQSPQSFHADDVDLEALTIEAEEEWQDIRHAFSFLEDNFGDDFQPLGPEFSSSIETPFGPALQYRTYAIAGIWMNFYMALIVCHRAHPSMPPAAMVAAGIAARHTSDFANEIGRIVAGIAPDCSLASEVTPGVGAALVECGTAIFVGAVQYQIPAQRAWTIHRLTDIARLTGWETALAVRFGLERVWSKAAETGKGPPYLRADYPEWVNAMKLHSSMDKERENGLSSIDETFGKMDMGEDPREGQWLPRGIL